MTHVIIRNAGLGLPRTKRREERRENREAAGRTGLRRFLGVMTGGAYSAVTAGQTQDLGAQNIADQQARAQMEQEFPADAALNDMSGDIPASAPAIIQEAASVPETLAMALTEAGVDQDVAGATDAEVILSPEVFGQQVATFPEAAVTQCACAVPLVAQAMGLPSDQLTLQAGMMTCLNDPATFLSGAARNGIGVDSCKPWYLRRSTFLVGGAAVAAAVLLRSR